MCYLRLLLGQLPRKRCLPPSTRSPALNNSHGTSSQLIDLICDRIRTLPATIIRVLKNRMQSVNRPRKVRRPAEITAQSHAYQSRLVIFATRERLNATDSSLNVQTVSITRLPVLMRLGAGNGSPKPSKMFSVQKQKRFEVCRHRCSNCRWSSYVLGLYLRPRSY